MGQGFSLTTLSAGSANIDVPELADLQYEKSLGAARFMKTVRARHRDGLVVARVVMKPYAQFDFRDYVHRLLHERKLLADVPNALPYHRIIETAACGYLARQYVHSSLYDRLSTRPFLEDVEKKWLSFQLLCAVRDCHAHGVFHGDIKTENVLVTSWNWLYLADFSSSYKPAHLPEDNPADFSFYFDLSGRRTCYLAPERFLASGQQTGGESEIDWAMDVFSVGCVIAELFLEAPIFSLSQLFKYRQGEYSPEYSHINRIPDVNVRELVLHMIQLDPSSRMSAEDYLTHWRDKVFPGYFYGFLQQYMYSITDPSSGRKPVTSGSEHLGEPDDRIEQIYNDYDKISHLLTDDAKVNAKFHRQSPRLNNMAFPLFVNIPNYQFQLSVTSGRIVDDGNLIFLTIVVSCLRGTARASARSKGFELLMAFSERLTDEAKLDRVIPYVAQMLTDKSDYIKISALRTLTQVLAMVQVVSPLNAYIFPEYILPRLESFLPEAAPSNPLVRMQYAFCIGTLATTAARYLDMTQALRVDGPLPLVDPETEDDLSASSHRSHFDADRRILIDSFERHTKALLTDSDIFVRRAMLRSVSDLCVFFGNPRANDIILSHLNTYLNDPDWMLKCAFFEAIVAVAVFVGGAGLEGYILPLMVQALTDPEEFVVEKVMRALSSMAELGLFQRSTTWELVDIVARLTMHPNPWIREAVTEFISVASKYLTVADTQSIFLSIVKPYLKVIPSAFTQQRIQDSLRNPMSRLVTEMAANWALQSQNGMFWISAKKQHMPNLGSVDASLPTVHGQDEDKIIVQQTPKAEEDELWLRKLRNAGLSLQDDYKLVAMREFIWKTAHRRHSDRTILPSARLNAMIALKDLGVKASTVLFNEDIHRIVGLTRDEASSEGGPKPVRSIQDALLDASTTENVKTVHLLSPERTVTIAPTSEIASNTKLLVDVPLLTNASQQVPDLPSGVDTLHKESLHVPQDSSYNDLSTSASAVAQQTPSLRHRSSALGLMGKGENKASAETGTTSANVFGKVHSKPPQEILPSNHSSVPIVTAKSPTTYASIKFRKAHDYTGNDPTVLKLLDSMLLDRFPVGQIDFGPHSSHQTRQNFIRSKDTQQTGTRSPWRPEGVLVASLTEHTAAINRVLTSSDQAFFISGSDDGTVKIWDTSRLERNITRRSRQTYRLGESVKVTSIVFVEHTYSFVATGNDGSVHVVRVEYHQSGNGSAKFGRPRLLQKYQLPKGDYAVWSDHTNQENKSMLFLATNTSKVIVSDLKAMHEFFTLRNPLYHGTPTCFCVDRRAHWLLLGTSHGVLDLWDLRFRVRLKAWVFPGASPIYRLSQIYQPKPKRTRMYIAGGTGAGETTVWDLEKSICKEIYRTGTSDNTDTKKIFLQDIEEEKAGGMLGRFATTLEPTNASNTERGVRALAEHTQTVDVKGDSKHTFLLTAGPDRKIRYWDTSRPEGSMIVNGLEANESKPQYTMSHPHVDVLLVTERLSLPQGQDAECREGRTLVPNRRNPPNTSRNGLISLQQQQLLKGHLDDIMDVALVEQPYGMVISADRSGVINLFM